MWAISSGRAAVGMRRQVPIRKERTFPSRISWYAFNRPMPRAFAASSGVSSSLSVSSSLRRGTDACRRGVTLQVDLEASLRWPGTSENVVQNEEIFLLPRVSS